MAAPLAPKAVGTLRPQWGVSSTDITSILKLLASGEPVVGFVAPTGSGKSTTAVEAIVNIVPSCVFVVEPTVVAADSLRRRMQSFLGKDKVGMAAEGYVQYVNPKLTALRDQRTPSKQLGNTTKLVYCTAGHMRRVFLDIIKYGMSRGLKDVDLAFTDVLILDEAHKLRNLHPAANAPMIAKQVRDVLEKRVFKYVLMLTATPIQNVIAIFLRIWRVCR